MRSSLRNKISEPQVVIIDEVYLVSNILLLRINQRLVEIFGYNSNIPFAGLTIIFLWRFFSNYQHSMFKLAELTEVMREKGGHIH